MSRNLWLKMRVNADERARIQSTAEAAGMTTSDFIRHRVLDYRLRSRGHEREVTLHLARLGANLNQLARWANTHKGDAESLEVLICLDRLRRELSDLKETLPCI